MVKKYSSKSLEVSLRRNVSSMEDSITVNKNISIRYLSYPDKQILGYNFKNYLLSKNLSEKFTQDTSEIGEDKPAKREFPMGLSPICFHSILDDNLELPRYLSWEHIRTEFNRYALRNLIAIISGCGRAF